MTVRAQLAGFGRALAPVFPHPYRSPAMSTSPVPRPTPAAVPRVPADGPARAWRHWIGPAAILVAFLALLWVAFDLEPLTRELYRPGRPPQP